MLELILLVLVAMILFMWYMGGFHKVKVEKETFRGGHYFYKNYQLHIKDVEKVK